MKKLYKLFSFIFIVCLFSFLSVTTVFATDKASGGGHTLDEKTTAETTRAGGSHKITSPGASTTVAAEEEEEEVEDPRSSASNVGEGICSETTIKHVLRLFGWIILILQISVPFIIIIRGTFIFYKAVVSDSDKSIKDSAIEFGKKVALGVVVFFIPTIADTVYTAISNFSTVKSDYDTCETCLLNPGDCD